MSGVSKMLRHRRTELGMTLEEVGRIVGVGKSTVLKWENGNIRNMGIDKIVPLAKALKIDLVDFVYVIKQEYEG